MSRVLPILFNTDMVRAILDGRKTVTRRCVKHDVNAILNSPYHKKHPEVEDKQIISKLCLPPYHPGDILYVRETWCDDRQFTHDDTVGRYFYRVDGLYPREGDYVYPNVKWRSSIHMPKEAARIWLKVTDVRVERLQDITEEQAVKEGVSKLYDDLSDKEYYGWSIRAGVYPKAKEDWGYKNYLWHGHFGKHGTGNWQSDAWDYQYSSYDNAVDSFSSLWNSTIKKSDLARYGWDANPYVFVIEFERCEKPEECILAGMEPAENKRPCIGYGRSEYNDEPCEICKGCKDCEGNQDE